MLNPQKTHCMGCYRTLTEIKTWSTLPTDTRLAIMATLQSRVLPDEIDHLSDPCINVK